MFALEVHWNLKSIESANMISYIPDEHAISGTCPDSECGRSRSKWATNQWCWSMTQSDNCRRLMHLGFSRFYLKSVSNQGHSDSEHKTKTYQLNRTKHTIRECYCCSIAEHMLDRMEVWKSRFSAEYQGKYYPQKLTNNSSWSTGLLHLAAFRMGEPFALFDL